MKMRFLHSLFLVSLTVIGIGCALYHTYSYFVDNANHQISFQDTQNASRPEVDMPQQKTNSNIVSLSKDEKASVIKTVKNTLPSDWIESKTISGAPYKPDYTVSQALASPDLVTHEVKAGMGNLPTSGINKGAVIFVGFKDANIDDSIATSDAYAQFITTPLGGTNPINHLESGVINFSGQSAAFTHYSDIENVSGGWATVETLVGEEVLQVTLTYGTESSFEEYRDMFTNIVNSIKFE